MIFRVAPCQDKAHIFAVMFTPRFQPIQGNLNLLMDEKYNFFYQSHMFLVIYIFLKSLLSVYKDIIELSNFMIILLFKY